MPHAWKCPRPGWIELGTTCCTGRHPCPQHRGRNYPNHSMIVVLWVTCQCQEETAHLRPKWKTYTLHALTSQQALPLLKSNFPRHMIFKQFWVTEVKNHRCRCQVLSASRSAVKVCLQWAYTAHSYPNLAYKRRTAVTFHTCTQATHWQGTSIKMQF